LGDFPYGKAKHSNTVTKTEKPLGHWISTMTATHFYL